MRELRVHETAMHPSAVLARMSLAKNRMETAEGFLAEAAPAAATSSWARCGSATASSSPARGRSTSTTCCWRRCACCASTETVRAHYRKRYRYVLVDEYQDTNHPQYEIVKQIGGEHRNVCVVGDDDQSIYGWRGADIRKILGFHRDFEGAKVVRLQTNYRSTRPILDAANLVIRQNAARHDKALESARRRRRAGALRAPRRTRRRRRSSWSRRCASCCAARRREPRDFAILCRTQVQFRPFEGELRANGLPYVVVGGMSFFDRKEVRDIVAYLRLAVNPRDETSLLRVINTPARGRGQGEPRPRARVRHRAGHLRRRGLRARRPRSRGSSPQAVEGYREAARRARRLGPRRRRTRPRLPPRALPGGGRLSRRGRRGCTPTR